MNKDELLGKIVELNKELETEKSRYDSLWLSVKDAEATYKDLEQAYNEIKERYYEAAKGLGDFKSQAHSSEVKLSRKKKELEQYQRELGRILSNERIREEYNELAEAFRNKCLDATWRKENRDDGLGALEHQIEGAINAAIAKRVLLGDKRGLGKTLTSIIYMDLIEAQRVIAVVPKDTIENFIRELNMWAPHRTPINLSGMSKAQRDFVLSTMKDFPTFTLVLNYEAWRRDPQLIQDLINLKADTLIEDEAHRAKTMSTTTAKGILNLRFGYNICPGCDNPHIVTHHDKKHAKCTNCGYGYEGKTLVTEFCSIKNVMPMTGTPILNKPQELFPQAKMLDPENFTTLGNFLQDFCWEVGNGKWTWRPGAEKKIVEILGPRFIARDRKSAGIIIPPSTPILHKISMEDVKEFYPAQYKAYQQARKAAQIVLDPDRKLAMNIPVVITQLLRLRQVITWPAAIEMKIPIPETDEVEIINLNVHESAKMDKAEELLNEIIEEGDRAVVFSQFKGPLRELRRRLGEQSVIYDGDTTTLMRDEIQRDFDARHAGDNPRWKVALCNYKAAGEGLNLNAASQMVILDEEWNPGRQEQAYGRIDRLGQTKETQIHTIRVENSIDTWMANIQEFKKNLIDGFEQEMNLSQVAFEALRNDEM